MIIHLAKLSAESTFLVNVTTRKRYPYLDRVYVKNRNPTCGNWKRNGEWEPEGLLPHLTTLFHSYSH
jgi:hypothetical protein